MATIPSYFDPLLPRDEKDQDKFRRATILHFADNGMDIDEDVRIYQLTYTRHGRQVVATVGEHHDPSGGDYVEFIFKSATRFGLYYVAGPYSGVMKGNPAMVGPDMNPKVTLFSDD